MNDMKCPLCQQELKDQWLGQNVAHEYFNCPKCKMNGNPKLWQELIRTKELLEIECAEHSMCHTQMFKTTEKLERTRKALDIAVDALKKINMRCQNTVRNHLERATIRGELCDISFYARKAIDDVDNLEQITALEQKDK